MMGFTACRDLDVPVESQYVKDNFPATSSDYAALFGTLYTNLSSGYAISYWQTANLGNDYAPVAMLWRVPAMRTNPAGDYLQIEPGIPGDGTSVDIQSITIDVLSS